jgi:hypothetical protein
MTAAQLSEQAEPSIDPKLAFAIDVGHFIQSICDPESVRHSKEAERLRYEKHD